MVVWEGEMKLRQWNRFGVFAVGVFVTIWANVSSARVITANVVALDQAQVYNRFNANNPYGMMYALRSDVEPITGTIVSACNVRLKATKRPRPLVLRGNVGDSLSVTFTNYLCSSAPGAGNNRPTTRIATMTAAGLTVTGATTDPVHVGTSGIAPGASHVYTWNLEREGTHLIFDNGAPAGGDGDGGSVVLGLFGAINVEPAGSVWYRSQVTAAELATATNSTTGVITYTSLAILNASNQIISSDLNAIISGFTETDDGVLATTEGNFREFTVIFHDEIKAIQAYSVLETSEQMHGVRDGFAINYGAQGMGPALLANRAGNGPNAACIECAFEEMALSSWANGDPSLLVQYPSDPSNVHHSYIGDRVKFRNLHAGPKETHVFHLHAHQWLAQTDGTNSSYLDSQSIGPRQGYTYEITYGGSGNRNKTVGDSIFHCHLYPHFVQGMWELWRSHDVYEDGTRKLPDGVLGVGTSPTTGVVSGGTPIPAIVPIPGQAMAPKPTYNTVDAAGKPNNKPGYPFFIAGRAGHRAPQPPLDMVATGGLPRHIIVGGTRTVAAGLSANDFTTHLTSAQVQLLDPNGEPLEKAAMAFHAQVSVASKFPDGTVGAFTLNGRPGVAGAPYADPCPAGTPTRTYGVSAIQLDLIVNKRNWHDPQARINVLDANIGMAGTTTAATPFYFRANSGECVIFNHTNRIPGVLQKDAFQMKTPTDIIGQHIHLVKFDVTASDGSANGWNYEDGTFAADTIVERIVASKAAGGWARNPAGTNVTLTASGFQTTRQRWWADPLLNAAGKDRTIRTVFTHDHFSPSSIQHHGFYSGLLVEPAGSIWKFPDGTPMTSGVGHEAMIVGAVDAVTHPDHREFAMAVADYAIVYRDPCAISATTNTCTRANAVNPPPITAAPEIISASDPGTMLVNYKHEPIPLRLSFDGGLPINQGRNGDMADIFMNNFHDIPYTNTFYAFAGDRINFRLIQGAQEEQHVFTVHGMRWKRDISNPNSPYVNAQEVGISEHFEADVDPIPRLNGAGNGGSYLYHFGSTDDLWNGAWGIIEMLNNPGTNPALAALPNNNGTALSAGNIGTDGCPTNAPIKNFTLQAWAAKNLLPGQTLKYNVTRNIVDPSGLLLIRSQDEASLRAGTKIVEPLVIRANAGDCIKVALTNKLPVNTPAQTYPPTAGVPDHVGDAPLPPITSMIVDNFRPSDKVGLHAQLVHYDVRTSDGANIGGNPEQLAAPGLTINYTWYAGIVSVQTIGTTPTLVGTPQEFGAINLRSYGDVIKHGAQGLVGALIIEPTGATYTDVTTGAVVNSGAVAKINLPGGMSFKEFVVVYQDGLNLKQGAANIVDQSVADDPEDTGEKAVNYRTEPFWAKLGVAPDANLNFSTFPSNFLLGPIETPVFRASIGDDVRFRVLQPDGRARQGNFTVFGHGYADHGVDKLLAEGASLMAVGKGVTAKLYGGAKAGTWIFRDGPAHMFSGGIWGRMEVQ
jgi:manganese oxidase